MGNGMARESGFQPRDAAGDRGPPKVFLSCRFSSTALRTTDCDNRFPPARMPLDFNASEVAGLAIDPPNEFD